MTTYRAWKYTTHVWNMLRQLPSSYDNGQSMVIDPWGINHAPSVVIVSWQRTEHGNTSQRYETCSVSCLCLITTFRAWLFIPKVWIMLRQLSSSHDNSQSMVHEIYHISMKHVPQVVFASWQQTEHGYTSQRYELCSVSCFCLIISVRAFCFCLIWFFTSTQQSFSYAGRFFLGLTSTKLG